VTSNRQALVAFDGVLSESAVLAREQPRHRSAPGIVLAITCAGVFMAALDSTVVGIAFPNMLQSFHGSTLGQLSWVFNAYGIALAAFVVPAGRLVDLMGRRKMFTISVAGFTLTSAVCAAAPTVGILIAARTAQGIAAATLVPASLALAVEAHPGPARTHAVSVWSATFALAAGVGPALGGLLIGAWNWRLAFVINLPVGVALLWSSRRRLTESRAPGSRSLPDLPGALLLAASVAALTFAFIQAGTDGWTDPAVIVIAAAAVAGLVAFGRRCLVQPTPVVDVELLKAPNFAAIQTVSAAAIIAFGAASLANLLLLMIVWGMSPLQAGLAFTPAPFIAVVASLAVGRFARHIDLRWLLTAGGALIALGQLQLVFGITEHPDWLGVYFPASCTWALGVGLAFPVLSEAAMGAAARERYAAATGFSTLVRELGTVIGVAVAVTIIGTQTSVGAFRDVWLFSVVLTVAAVAATPFLRPIRPPEAPTVEIDDDVGGSMFPPLLNHQRGRDSGSAGPDALSGTAFLANIPADIRARLEASAATISLEADAWLFHRGDAADAVYVVQAGHLQVLLAAGAGELEVIRDIRRGDVIGELGVLSSTPRSASVRAVRDSILLRIPAADIDSLVNRDLAALRAIVTSLGRQLQASRPASNPGPGVPAAIALAGLTSSPRPLASELSDALTRCAPTDIVHAHDLSGPDQLNEVIARAERSGVTVLLVAGRLDEPDPWSAACIRHADRVVVAVDEVPGPDHPVRRTAPRRCDVALCGIGDSPLVEALLDEFDARTSYRLPAVDRDGAVASMARRLCGRSLGIVLSGGGARGFAHIGVLQALHEAGIGIDRVGGVSMGAFVGGLLAQGRLPDEIDAVCYEEWIRRNPLADYGFPRHSLIRGRRVTAMLERLFPERIEALPRSFFAVTVDVISASLIIHRRGPTSVAIGASVALPVFAPAVPWKDRLLVDGGIIDNLPVQTMAMDAEGPVIASDVSEPSDRELGVERQVPTIAENISMVISLGIKDSQIEARKHADLLISPDRSGVSTFDFYQLDLMRDRGLRAGREAVELLDREGLLTQWRAGSRPGLALG
jgi:NTE family protein